MKFLEDVEINLDEHDLLSTKQYAESLMNAIKQAPKRFTIGLFGEWGSGKSSIIKTAQIKLESEEETKVKFITYDAWKYANDSFRRTFLLEMAKSLGVSKDKQKQLFDDFYTNQNKDIKIKKQKNYGFMFFFFLIFVVIFIASLAFDLDADKILTVQAFIGLLILGIHFYKNSTDDLKFSMTEPLFFAPEQFEECFNELVDKALNKPSNDKWFLPFMDTESRYEKLVIVIDNIDRCDKKLSYELLTNIKNFLGDKDDVIFIIPLDNNALKRHLKVNDSSEKEADEFLRKFFNVTLTIKAFKALDLYDFTDELNIKEELNLNPDSIGIISEEYASNPRRIIQLLNNLSTELEVLKSRLDDNFISKNQSLIVVLLILREEWNTFYKKVFLQPHILAKHNLDEFKDDISLKSFLHRTKAISTSANTDLIEKVLYNKDNHQNVSSEVLESLSNNNMDVVATYLKDKSNYSHLMKYLVDKLKLEISRGTYKTSALQAFKHILTINTIHPIDRHHNIQIEGIFSDSEQWLFVIDNLGKDDADNFFKYANDIANQNLTQLREISLGRFKHFWSKDSEITDDDPELWTGYLEVFINYTESESVLKKLKGMFHRFYVHYFISGDYLYEKEWLKESKLKDVIGEGLIDVLIEKLDFNLSENKFYSELLYFSNHNILNINHVQKVVKKLMSLTLEVNSENLLEHIQKLTELFKNIPSEEKNIQEIITYVNSLSNNRMGLNVNNQRVRINLINELNNDKDKIKIMLSFYLEIYRMTLNNTNILPLCTALLNKYPVHKTTFYKMLINLRNEHNCSLKPFFDYLLKETTISDEILDLYSKLFIYADINMEKVKEKFAIYIKSIIDGEDNGELSVFMDNIIGHVEIQELIAELILKLDPKEIKKLPLKTQSLAYDTFNEDIALVENDIGILKEMLKTPKYVENIIDVIIGKLQYKTKVKDAMKLIEGIDHLSKEQKDSLVTALYKRKGGEKLNLKVDEEIESLNAFKHIEEREIINKHESNQ